VEIDIRSTWDDEFVNMHHATIDAYVEGRSRKVKDLMLWALISVKQDFAPITA
jgi:hypothetical protein